MEAFGRDAQVRFAPELFEFLRKEAPKLSSGSNDSELNTFCARCIDFAVTHGLDLKKHIAQLALCFLKLGVDLESTQPPQWVTQPREEGSLPDNDEWLQYVRNGSRVQLSPQ